MNYISQRDVSSNRDIDIYLKAMAKPRISDYISVLKRSKYMISRL